MYTKDDRGSCMLYVTFASYMQALEAAEEGDFETYKKKNKRSLYCSIASIVTGIIVYVILATVAATLVLNFLVLVFFFIALLSRSRSQMDPDVMNNTLTF